MKITCQACQAKYNVADDKVQGKIVKIRCRKCGATIVAQGNGAGTNGTASRGPTPPQGFAGDDVQWHVNLGEGDPRTMTVRELIEAYNTGVVTHDTFIWTDGMDDWKPLSEVEPVVAALHADAANDAPPPSARDLASIGPNVPQVERPASVKPEPAFQSSAVAESIAPGYEAPTAIASFAMQAQVEAPVEPKRAAVKREPRARDLFASRVASEDVQTSAPVAPQLMSSVGAGSSVDAGKLTGERNENSVLFSLAVLTKDSADAPAAPAKNVSEDSGLIDLKALAAKAESVRPSAPGSADAAVFAPPLGLAASPLGSPLGAFGVGAPEERPKSMLPLLIGGGAAAAVLGVLCVFVGMKLAGSGTAAAASAAPSASAAPLAATAEPSATASATAPAASTTADTSATASAAPKPKPVTPVYHAAAQTAPAKPATTGAAPAATAAPPPAAKKGGSTDCGCNGDLMCLMKCSAH